MLTYTGSGLSSRRNSSFSTAACSVLGTLGGGTGEPPTGDMVAGEAGEVRVGDGLLYIVPVSFVFCREVNTMVGVGRA